MAANVMESVGATLKSMERKNRVRTAATDEAGGQADNDELHTFSNSHAQNIHALGAESDANADFCVCAG